MTTPWDNAGTEVDGSMTTEEILEKANLTWNVLKRPVWTDAVSSEQLEALGFDDDAVSHESRLAKGPIIPKWVSGSHTILRSDTLEPITPFVGDGYRVIQNDEAFNRFRVIIDAAGLELVSVGDFDDSPLVWMMARLPETYSIGDERISGYFIFIQSHDYGNAAKILFSPVRFPGGLSLVQPVAESKDIMAMFDPVMETEDETIWDIGFMSDQIDQMMTNTREYMTEFVEIANQLASSPVDDEYVIRYFIDLFQSSTMNQILRGCLRAPDKITDLPVWDHSKRMLKSVPQLLVSYEGCETPPCKGTKWGLLMAVMHHLDHNAGQRESTRLTSSWIGANSKRKLKAFHYLTEAAG